MCYKECDEADRENTAKAYCMTQQLQYKAGRKKKNSLHHGPVWDLNSEWIMPFCIQGDIPNFLGGWQLATNGYSSHGHFSIQFQRHILFSFSSKILVLWPLCDILYWLYVPSVLSEGRKVGTVKTV